MYKIYRNPKLLALARFAPICFGCHKMNDGTIVACHSNQIRDGKGTGIKSHDYRIAMLDSECHYKLDNGKDLTKEQRLEMFEKAHRETIGWLFESGKIVIS